MVVSFVLVPFVIEVGRNLVKELEQIFCYLDFNLMAYLDFYPKVGNDLGMGIVMGTFHHPYHLHMASLI